MKRKVTNYSHTAETEKQETLNLPLNKHLLSVKDEAYHGHSSLSINSSKSEFRQRTHSFKGSNYSLHVVTGLDTGALYITRSHSNLPPSLKGSLGSLVKLRHSHNQLHKDVHEHHSNTLLSSQHEDQDKVEDTDDNSNTKWLDITLLKDIRFLTFCIGIGLYTLSFQASYVFIPPLAIQKKMTHLEAAYIVSVAGGLETTGSILSGAFLDFPVIKPHRINIYNITMFALGILTFLMPLMQSFWMLSVICGIYGYLLGSCLAQKATLIVDILGVEKLVSSFGILVCFQGIGVLIGPPLSGLYLLRS